MDFVRIKEGIFTIEVIAHKKIIEKKNHLLV